MRHVSSQRQCVNGFGELGRRRQSLCCDAAERTDRCQEPEGPEGRLKAGWQ